MCLLLLAPHISLVGLPSMSYMLILIGGLFTQECVFTYLFVCVCTFRTSKNYFPIIYTTLLPFLPQVPPALMDCHPVCGVDKNYLYILLVTDKVTGNMHYSFPGHISQLSFGILTSKLLPYLQVNKQGLFQGASP